MPGLPPNHGNTDPAAQGRAIGQSYGNNKGPFGALQGPIDAIGSVVSAFQTLTNPSTWQRVGLFMMALVFVIIGFAIVAGNPGIAAAPVTTPYKMAKVVHARKQKALGAKA